MCATRACEGVAQHQRLDEPDQPTHQGGVVDADDLLLETTRASLGDV